MPTFLVEVYLPRSEAGRRGAPIVSRRGSRTRYRWSVLLPDEEIGFHVIDGPTLDAVRRAAVQARLRPQRITEAVLIEAAGPNSHGGSS